MTYAEQEYHALADEQELIWPAEGERAARQFQVRARGLDRAAAGAEFLASERESEVRQAQADYQHAARLLSPHVRRESGAKLRYWICWPVLWFGDTAGVWSAAITNGDVPSIAFGQSLASGLAAACAGLVGAELKYIRMARSRQRDPESLTDDERRYRHLFTAEDGGLGIVKLIGLLSITVVALVAVGIFNLRTSIEGNASGLTFGLLAAATAIGSGLLGFSAADEVADLLGTMARRIHKAERRYLKLVTSPVFRRQAEAEEAARSLHAEHQLRGQAAGKRVDSLSWRVQRRNPQVLGHGFPVSEQGGVIGRRIRRGGAA
ncbi:hypothetical protein EDD99_5166 [Streptomyces sp. 846.5]|nr:hypothetical protein [Streptomyces sp. 846.5]TDU06603.1 hypothetical protein EDD99_5166 [Streptomyces sp. 846.5]